MARDHEWPAVVLMMPWALACLLVVGASSLRADEGEVPAAQAMEPTELEQPTAPPGDAEGDASDDASSDAVMRELLSERAAPPVTEPEREPVVESIPSRVGAPAARVDVNLEVLGLVPPDEAPTLRREGEFVVNRRGRLLRPEGSGRLAFVFEPTEGQEPLPPMFVQLCRDLETMEAILRERQGPVLFAVSGQVHTYRGVNYLLPTMAKPPIDAPAEAEPTVADPAAPDTTPGTAPQDADTAGADDVMSSEEVLAQLLESREAAPAGAAIAPTGTLPTLPATSGAGANPVAGTAPTAGDSELRREGEFIISRRGRIVRSPDGAHVLFVFEADGRESPEPPMILLPCQLLETMEGIVQQRGDRVVFVLSGQVFTYHGANYLLPTMMKIAVDSGNLN